MMKIFISSKNKKIDRYIDKKDTVALCKYLQDPDYNIRQKAVVGLVDMGDNSLKALYDLSVQPNIHFNSVQSSHRNIADSIVKIIKDRPELLAPATSHTNKYIRWHAVMALGKHKGPQIISTLTKAIYDSFDHVRAQAFIALRESASSDAIIPLILAMNYGDKDIAKSGKNEFINLMRKFNEPEAILISLYNSQNNPQVKESIIKHLLERGNLNDAEFLIQALRNNDNEHIQRSIIEILGDLGKKKAIQPLMEIFEEENMYLKLAAIEAIIKLNGFESAKLLLEYLDDPKTYVQHRVIGYLANFKEDQVAESLVAYINKKGALSESALKAAKTLVAIGNAKGSKGIDSIIDALFTEMWNNDQLFKQCEFFGDYKDLILKSSGYVISDIRQGGDSKNYRINYSKYSFDSVNSLCEINTKISSNILHKVLQLKDINVEVGQTCFETLQGKIGYQEERNMAKKELDKRGNPSYEPEIYLQEDWKI